MIFDTRPVAWAGARKKKFVSASRRCNGREATARLSNQHASRMRSPDLRCHHVVVANFDPISKAARLATTKQR